MPFLQSSNKKRDQILAVDLGSRHTKAVLLQRQPNGYSLAAYAIQDAPIYEKAISPQLLGDHLKEVVKALKPKTKKITLSVGVADTILRNTELPAMPVSEMRLMLKFNSKNYLQQELPNYVFDCSIIPPASSTAPGAPADPKATPKFKVWVGGGKSQLVMDLQAAIKNAGLVPDQITLGILGAVNAFELSQPEIFSKEVIALVDLGFKNSTINILAQGELILSRVVAIGGDKLTAGLAEAMNVNYAEAEGIKVGMPAEVESALQPLLSPLGRELRASIDFFEHQQDKVVSQVFVSGGAARSDFILQTLQGELMVACQRWNPGSFLALSLSPQQMGEVEQITPQLTVALGAAIASI